MQERGVEPLHLAVQDPKSCASANSATPAVVHRIVYRQAADSNRKRPSGGCPESWVSLPERPGACRRGRTEVASLAATVQRLRSASRTRGESMKHPRTSAIVIVTVWALAPVSLGAQVDPAKLEPYPLPEWYAQGVSTPKYIQDAGAWLEKNYTSEY